MSLIDWRSTRPNCCDACRHYQQRPRRLRTRCSLLLLHQTHILLHVLGPCRGQQSSHPGQHSSDNENPRRIPRACDGSYCCCYCCRGDVTRQGCCYCCCWSGTPDGQLPTMMMKVGGYNFHAVVSDGSHPVDHGARSSESKGLLLSFLRLLLTSTPVLLCYCCYTQPS